ncbi:hypothetical protein ES703_57408 [subsurface metagenome]
MILLKMNQYRHFLSTYQEKISKESRKVRLFSTRHEYAVQGTLHQQQFEQDDTGR